MLKKIERLVCCCNSITITFSQIVFGVTCNMNNIRHKTETFAIRSQTLYSKGLRTSTFKTLISSWNDFAWRNNVSDWCPNTIVIIFTSNSISRNMSTCKQVPNSYTLSWHVPIYKCRKIIAKSLDFPDFENLITRKLIDIYFIITCVLQYCCTLHVCMYIKCSNFLLKYVISCYLTDYF